MYTVLLAWQVIYGFAKWTMTIALVTLCASLSGKQVSVLVIMMQQRLTQCKLNAQQSRSSCTHGEHGMYIVAVYLQARQSFFSLNT